jgi:thiol-disulfide isomerase/thioredoxin
VVETLGRRQLLRLGAAAAGQFAILGCLAPPPAASSPLVETTSPLDAPELDIPDLDGKRHLISDYRGKVVVVAFWAAWCPPCRKEMPSLARLIRSLPDEGFAILAVNLGDGVERIDRFLGQIDHDGLPVLTDRSGGLASLWHVRGLPVSYVIDAAGQIRYAVMGSLEWDEPAVRRQILSLHAS